MSVCVTCSRLRCNMPRITLICFVLNLLSWMGQASSVTDHTLRSRRDVSRVVCNPEITEWACGCSGCDDLTSVTFEQPCCSSHIPRVMRNQAINITAFNLTSHDVTADLQTRIQGSVSEILNVYCKGYPDDCQRDITNYRSTDSIFFHTDHVVLVNVTDLHDSDKDQDNLSIVMVVLSPGADHDPVSAILIQRALLNQSSDLESTVDWRIQSIKVMDPIVDPPPEGLPVKMIVAGSVLGFILVVSCVVSAVKAVRDRRLIKERNSHKREQKFKRHKELQDSFRKTSPKKSPAHVAGNGDAACAPYNGDIGGPSPSSSQIVQVVVHSDYEKPPTYADVLHDSPSRHSQTSQSQSYNDQSQTSKSQTSISNVHPEVQNNVPNGYVTTDQGIQSNRLDISKQSEDVNGDKSRQAVTSEQPVEVMKADRVRAENPGVVNRAYSIEEDAAL